MEKHASSEIINLFDQDVEANKIELISDTYLREIGMFSMFQHHVNELKSLFNPSDLGEVYAIAMARTLGCLYLITDDIKENGPYYMLTRVIDSDVIPFAFFEILFLDYLEDIITAEQFLSCFENTCSCSMLNMDCTSKLKAFIRRFWIDPYSKRDKEWMQSFCTQKSINAKQKLEKLQGYLKTRKQS